MRAARGPANPANPHNSLKKYDVFLKLYALAGLAGWREHMPSYAAFGAANS